MTYAELVSAVEAAAKPGDIPTLYRAVGTFNGADIRIDSTEPDGWLTTCSYLNDINGFGLRLYVHYDNVEGGFREALLVELPQDPIHDQD